MEFRNLSYLCNAYSNYINLHMCLIIGRLLLSETQKQMPTPLNYVVGICEMTSFRGDGISSVFFEFTIGFEEFDVGEAQVLEGIIGHFSP